MTTYCMTFLILTWILPLHDSDMVTILPPIIAAHITYRTYLLLRESCRCSPAAILPRHLPATLSALIHGGAAAINLKGPAATTRTSCDFNNRLLIQHQAKETQQIRSVQPHLTTYYTPQISLLSPSDPPCYFTNSPAKMFKKEYARAQSPLVLPSSTQKKNHSISPRSPRFLRPSK